MTIRNVGLIGTGLMGHGIGKNLLEKGYHLTVMSHRNREPVDDLVARGARELNNPHAIAKVSDMVILCVTGTPQVEQVVYGEYGLLGAVRSGFVIADCSTSEPHSTLKIAADVEAKGGHFVDTPMTRTPREAEAGKLALMVAGPQDVLAHIRVVLDSFADTIVYAGDVGAAHRLKLLNNFLVLGHAALAAEAIAVAIKAGVNMEAFRDIAMSGGAASAMFGRLINVPLANDDSQVKFAIRNARKDMRYYTNMTEHLPVGSFVAETVHQLYVVADNLGFGDRYLPRMVEALAQINGIEIKKP